MKKILLILAAFPLLMGASCSMQKITNNENNNDNSNAVVENDDNNQPSENNLTDQNDIIDDNTTAKTDLTYNSYTNKAMGYSINIPDKWYWQHFMKSDITAVGGDNQAIDYLAVDKDGITPLGSEHIGKIMIIASSLSPEDIAKNMESQDYSKTETTIDGLSTTKYEKHFGADNQMYPNSEVIKYVLEKNGQTYILSFNSETTDQKNIPAYESVFDTMVKSFSFVKN